jgi:hypothetical protein
MSTALPVLHALAERLHFFDGLADPRHQPTDAVIDLAA